VIWTDGLDAGSADLVQDLNARTLAFDGVAPLSGHVLDSLSLDSLGLNSLNQNSAGATSDQYLLVSADGEVVAAAVSHGSDPVELFVAPESRRRGLGTDLLAAALERGNGVWAHGDLPPASALAERLGLAATRMLLQMRRTLEPDWVAEQLALSGMPDGVRLRTFVPGQDEEQFLGVNARAFEWHPEQGRLDLAGLRAEMMQTWFDPEGFFLAVDDADTVLGFHWTKVHTTETSPRQAGQEDLGEVYVLGVDPLAAVDGLPVRGLGGALTTAGLAHLAGCGLRTVLLYVEGDNVNALKLYRRLGFEIFATDIVYDLRPERST